MYVRFTQRSRAHHARYTYSQQPPLVTLAAQVVVSERVNSQPRQRMIAHLATIRLDKEHDPETRQAFWRDVEARLAQMTFTDEARERLTEQVAKRIPRITHDEIAGMEYEAAVRAENERRWRILADAMLAREEAARADRMK